MKLDFKFDDGKVISHEVHERTFVIGRSKSCRVIFDSEGFSREHALIELIDGKIFITDLGSKNGVMINHVRIPKKMKVEYDLKLPLYMGDCFLTLDIKKELRDPDFLSLETHAKIAPGELYQSKYAPRKKVSKGNVLPVKKEVRAFDGKGLLIAFFVIVAFFVVSMNRDLIAPRDMNAEEKK